MVLRWIIVHLCFEIYVIYMHSCHKNLYTFSIFCVSFLICGLCSSRSPWRRSSLTQAPLGDTSTCSVSLRGSTTLTYMLWSTLLSDIFFSVICILQQDICFLPCKKGLLSEGCFSLNQGSKDGVI